MDNVWLEVLTVMCIQVLFWVVILHCLVSGYQTNSYIGDSGKEHSGSSHCSWVMASDWLFLKNFVRIPYKTSLFHWHFIVLALTAVAQKMIQGHNLSQGGWLHYHDPFFHGSCHQPHWTTRGDHLRAGLDGSCVSSSLLLILVCGKLQPETRK